MKYIYGHILTLVTLALLLASCAGESYPGLDYDYVLNEDIINDESGKTYDRGVMIDVYLAPDTYTMGSVSSTRGTGPFIVPDTTRQDSNHYENSTFHVFAFRASPDDQGMLDYRPDYSKHSGDTLDGKVNCLIDGLDGLCGSLSISTIVTLGILYSLSGNTESVLCFMLAASIVGV